MSKPIEKLLYKIPVLNILVRFLKRVQLPGYDGFTIYDLLELYILGIFKGAMSTRASAIAFSFFTAIFPFLLFVIILIPILPIDGFQKEFLGFLETFLPAQTTEFFKVTIFDKIGNNQNKGLLSSVFLLSTLFMANGVNAIFSGFENSFHQQLARNVFQQYLYALGVALILVFLVMLTVAIFGYFQIYIIQPIYTSLKNTGSIHSNSGISVWIEIAKYLFFVVMVYLATAILYYFGTKEGRQTRFLSIGALLTTLLVMFASYLFEIYINNFSQYNKLYGSIGALLILLLYLWLNSNILLLGYELNATLRGLKKLKNKH